MKKYNSSKKITNSRNGDAVLIIIFSLIFWKFILDIHYPFVGTDGPWTLSHLFSFLRGESEASTFAHHFKGNVYKTHILEILLFPFYYFLPTSTITFICVSYLFIFINSYLIRTIIKINGGSQKLQLLVALVYLSSSYTYGHRSETYTCLFFLITLLFFLKNKLFSIFFFNIIIIPLLGSICLLLHPMAGIIFSILIIILFLYDQINFKHLFFIYFSMSVWTLILSLGNLIPFIELYYNASIGGDTHTFDLSLLPKYFIFSSGLIPFIIYTIIIKPKKNFIIWTSSIFLMLYFGRSYYLVYCLTILMTLLLDKDNIKRMSLLLDQKHQYLIFIVFLFWGFIFTHINPLIYNIENISLGVNYRKILKKVDAIHHESLDNLIWASPQLAMEVIESKNSRLLHHFYKHIAGKKIQLKEGDLALFISESNMRAQIGKNILNKPDSLIIENIIKPSKGKLRIGTLFQERANEIGLWMVKIK